MLDMINKNAFDNQGVAVSQEQPKQPKQPAAATDATKAFLDETQQVVEMENAAPESEGNQMKKVMQQVMKEQRLQAEGGAVVTAEYRSHGEPFQDP